MENKILIIEDDKTMSKSLELTLMQNKFNCTSVSTVESAFTTLEKQRFFMAFLGLNLPDGSGFKMLNHINQNDIDVTVVVLSAIIEPEFIIKSFKLGAVDYLIKPVTDNTLLAAIDAAKRKREGKLPLLQKNLAFMYEQKLLSPREYEIFEMIVSGKKYQKIIKKLFITQNTLKTHLKSIFKKLHLTGRTEIVYQFNCSDIRDHFK